MKPAELIIKSIDFINQSQCNVVLKNDDIIETFGELILIKDKNGDYAYSGFGSKIEYIFFEKDKIYPIFDIDKGLYDDPDIMQKVRIAIAGAITEHCALKNPEDVTIIEVADYKPELEINEDRNRLRLPPSTRFVNKVWLFDDYVEYLKSLIGKAKTTREKDTLKESISLVSKYPDDLIMQVEVSIDSSVKDGDIFDAQKDLVVPDNGCKKEKMSLDELSEASDSRFSSTCQPPSDNEKAMILK